MPSSKGFGSGKQERSGEPLSIGNIVAGLLQRREFASGTQVGRLAASWTTVVGERLAEETAPTKLEGGTLTVSASSGAWGTQVQFLADEVRKKANESLGSEVVVRVRVVVAQNPAKPL
jgi:predicted nucleic acid-binding Zn ribbon protein